MSFLFVSRIAKCLFKVWRFFSLSNEFTDKLLAYRSSFMSFSFQADKVLTSIYTDVIEGMFEGRGLLRCCSIRVHHFTSSDCEVETRKIAYLF